jgi:hypothetical protein
MHFPVVFFTQTFGESRGCDKWLFERLFCLRRNMGRGAQLNTEYRRAFVGQIPILSDKIIAAGKVLAYIGGGRT